MGLRIATTAFVIFGLLLLVCWPVFVGAPPGEDAPRREQTEFVIRSGRYVIILLITFFTTTVLGWLMARKIREEGRKRSAENLKELIEGTLNDHARKQHRR